MPEARWDSGVWAEDRKLNAGGTVGNYACERKAIRDNPEDSRYKHLVHLRSHRSLGDTIS